jgi:hypothetical protein
MIADIAIIATEKQGWRVIDMPGSAAGYLLGPPALVDP